MATLLKRLIEAIANFFNRHKAEEKATYDTVRMLNRKVILDTWSVASGRGYVKDYELDTATEAFDYYVALGGNSYVHLIYDKLKDMKCKATLPKEAQLIRESENN